MNGFNSLIQRNNFDLVENQNRQTFTSPPTSTLSGVFVTGQPTATSLAMQLLIASSTVSSGLKPDSEAKLNAITIEREDQSGNNTKIGWDVMTFQPEGNNNVGIANNVLKNNYGNNNIGIGYNSLTTNIDGSNNLAFGVKSLFNNINGNNNIGIGYNTISSNTAGSSNIGIGTNALSSISGNYNISLGYNNIQSSRTLMNTVSIGPNVNLLRNNSGMLKFRETPNTSYPASNEFWLGDPLNGYINLKTGNINAVDVSAIIINTIDEYVIRDLYVGSHIYYGGDNPVINQPNVVVDARNLRVGFNVLGYDPCGNNNFDTSGNNNVGIGGNTLSANTQGNFNTTLGFDTLEHNTTGNSILPLENHH